MGLVVVLGELLAGPGSLPSAWAQPGDETEGEAEGEPPGDGDGAEGEGGGDDGDGQPTMGTPTDGEEPALPSLPPSESEKARGKKIEEVRIVGNRRIAKD